MFDLRKDLRIYTSKSASGLRAALDAGVRDGNKLVFSIRQSARRQLQR
jgi:hypothetical protein